LPRERKDIMGGFLANLGFFAVLALILLGCSEWTDRR